MPGSPHNQCVSGRRKTNGRVCCKSTIESDLRIQKTGSRLWCGEVCYSAPLNHTNRGFTMRNRTYAYILTIAVLVAAWSILEAAQQRGAAPGAAPGGRAGGPQPPVGSMPTRRFEKIVDGVYYVTSTGSMSSGSNAVLIVNDDDAMIIDPGETPAAAKAFLEDIKTVTNKPVKVVIDSHYHFDHAHGNQIFGPDVMVIGHDRTYDLLAGNPLKGQAYVTQAAPELLQQRLDALKAQPLPANADPQQVA